MCVPHNTEVYETKSGSCFFFGSRNYRSFHFQCCEPCFLERKKNWQIWSLFGFSFTKYSCTSIPPTDCVLISLLRRKKWPKYINLKWTWKKKPSRDLSQHFCILLCWCFTLFHFYISSACFVVWLQFSSFLFTCSLCIMSKTK